MSARQGTGVDGVRRVGWLLVFAFFAVVLVANAAVAVVALVRLEGWMLLRAVGGVLVAYWLAAGSWARSGRARPE